MYHKKFMVVILTNKETVNHADNEKYFIRSAMASYSENAKRACPENGWKEMMICAIV